jgi:hypothetical protein
MRPIERRTALRLGLLASLGAVGARSVVGEPIDGKGNDVCPCFVDIDGAVLHDDETIEVSGPCWVTSPPETLTVHVHVRGDRGARPTGDDTFSCGGSEDDEATFAVPATIRGENRFDEGDHVTIDATVHVRPDDDPHIVSRWNWSGGLG